MSPEYRHLVPDVNAAEIAHYWGTTRPFVMEATPLLPLNHRWLDYRRGVVLLGSGGPPSTPFDRVLREVRREARRIVRDGLRDWTP